MRHGLVFPISGAQRNGRAVTCAQPRQTAHGRDAIIGCLKEDRTKEAYMQLWVEGSAGGKETWEREGERYREKNGMRRFCQYHKIRNSLLGISQRRQAHVTGPSRGRKEGTRSTVGTIL